MSSNPKVLLQTFNNHFFEFIDDILNVFPDDLDILTAKNSFLFMKKINPKLLVKSWTTFVSGCYKAEIEAGDIEFFINKDYSKDIEVSENNKKIKEGIDRLRNPVKNMGTEDRVKIMKYLQNLSKLAEMYENTEKVAF
jgi:hypothetical protein